MASLCRRHGLRGDDADDFASWAKLKLVENDYAVILKFRGESSIATYLTVVISMLFREYRVRRWGRWRPSAEARRRGELAVRLEALVYRDGLSLDQAAESLRTSGDTDLSDRELAALLAELPPKLPLRPIESGSELLADKPAASGADDLILRDEAERQRRVVDEALSRALERLPAKNRLIVRMRFWENMTVANIARGLDLPQKPLHRRIDHALAYEVPPDLPGHALPLMCVQQDPECRGTGAPCPRRRGRWRGEWCRPLGHRVHTAGRLKQATKVKCFRHACRQAVA